MSVVHVGPHAVGEGHPLLLIAGPCVLEGRDFNLRHAEHLKEVCAAHGVPFVFKASFDKANRTSGGSHRGPGLQEGLRMLEDVKRALDLLVLTDVHESHQCAEAAEVVDVLQIPAFLCRQTDLLAAAGATGRVVNIKKGQFLAPDDMAYARDKTGAPERVLLTERGTTFGYRDLVVDYRGLSIMRRFAPVVFDGTHSVQQPGAAGGATGGNRALAPGLVRAAVAYGVDALFLEVHPDPDNAPSDGPNQLDFGLLERVLTEAEKIRGALQ
ncbi:MAG: 3-deoxy-8-phosphooctulonate synthase [Myxococcales bacterium]|nr:3-deoxy-8-phosphooctulonate synthase [Myxococcales bacterium]MCB9649583.1 3-deoxy-8-phosphooctulonate synthase [Deltaproteobacteria bacterium]